MKNWRLGRCGETITDRDTGIRGRKTDGGPQTLIKSEGEARKECGLLNREEGPNITDTGVGRGTQLNLVHTDGELW